MFLFPLRKFSAFFLLPSITVIFISCSENKLSPGEIRVRFQHAGTPASPVGPPQMLLIDMDPNIIVSEIRLTQAYPEQAALVEAFFKAAGEHVAAHSSRERKGWYSFRDIPPGHYWVLTPEPVLINGERLIWAHPARSGDPDLPAEVWLQRSNAAMILE